MQAAKSAGDQTKARSTRKTRLKNPRAQGASSQPQGGLEALLEGKVGSRQGGLSAVRQAGRYKKDSHSRASLHPGCCRFAIPWNTIDSVCLKAQLFTAIP